MDSNFLKLYPQYKVGDRLQNYEPVKQKCHFTSSTDSIDPRLQTDITKVRETFKDFLTPINNIKCEVDRLDLQTKDKHKTRHMVFSALSPISPLRRVSSLPDNIEDGNLERAAGLVGLALVNLPEDTRDLKAAYNQIFKGKLPKYDYKNYQHPFSFFRGTVLEPIVNKMGKVGVWLHKADVPLENTKFGAFLEKTLKFKTVDIQKTGREVSKITTDINGKNVIRKFNVYAQKIEGNCISKLVGKSLLRIPLIRVIALGLLELPSIIKGFSNGEKTKDKAVNGIHQTLKSGINVASILSGIGIVGAILARKGPAGSLLGMGIGSLAGAYVSNEIGDKLDELKAKY